MATPKATRPYMPGYGVLSETEGTGLLRWSWAETRLMNSRNYWLATVWPERRPHVMPVWGMWQEDAFWFSSSRGSRKARNLLANKHCVVTTEDAHNPVVVEGVAALVDDGDTLAKVLALGERQVRNRLLDRRARPRAQLVLPRRPGVGVRHSPRRFHGLADALGVLSAAYTEVALSAPPQRIDYTTITDLAAIDAVVGAAG